MRSKIRHAKSLARIILAELDKLPAAESAEIKRVENLTMPLVVALEAGYVDRVSEDGMEALMSLADILLSDTHKGYRALAARAQVGTEVEVTDFMTQERVVVRITKVPADRTWGFPAVYLTRTGNAQIGDPTTVSLFWGGQCKPLEV